jgi:hypothetical protein
MFQAAILCRLEIAAALHVDARDLVGELQHPVI